MQHVRRDQWNKISAADADAENQCTTFDPTKVDIVSKVMIISNIVERLKDDSIVLQPNFQRNKDLWDDVKQSRLIESLIVCIPLPTFYFDAGTDDKLEVVDGMQRLWTFKRFMALGKDDKYKLRLTGLEYMKEYEGYTFEDLPSNIKRRIREQEIITYIIKRGTPENVRVNIFTRINTGGMVLTKAEINNSVYRGKVADFLKDLAESEAFANLIEKLVDTSRMEDREYVNRFLAFYILGINKYEGNLAAYMEKVLSVLQDTETSLLARYQQTFVETMEIIRNVFAGCAFKKIGKDNKPSRRINKPLFECVSVTLAKLGPEQRVIILKQKEVFISAYKELFQDKNFVTSITSNTASISKVQTRYSYMERLIEGILENA